MNLKGEKLGTCGLEGTKGSPVEPQEVDWKLEMCENTRACLDPQFKDTTWLILH